MICLSKYPHKQPVIDEGDAIWSYSCHTEEKSNQWCLWLRQGRLVIENGSGYQKFLTPEPPYKVNPNNVYCALQDDGYLCLYEASGQAWAQNPPQTLGNFNAFWDSTFQMSVIGSPSDFSFDYCYRVSVYGDSDLNINANSGFDYRSLALSSIGLVPKVGSVLKVFVSFLWTENKMSLWDQIKDQVEALVNDKIANLEWETSIGYLKSLKDSIDKYDESIIRYENNKTDSNFDIMRSTFLICQDAFNNPFHQFQKAGFEVRLLPLFAQLGTLNLSLLRDGVLQYKSEGENWNVTQEDYEKRQNQYEEHINKWVNQNPVNQVGKSFADWNNQNSFKRFMRLNVIDVRDSWAYLSPLYKNGDEVRVSKEEIYAVIGSGDTNIDGFDTSFLKPAEDSALFNISFNGNEWICKYGFHQPMSNSLNFDFLNINPIISVSATCPARFMQIRTGNPDHIENIESLQFGFGNNTFSEIWGRCSNNPLFYMPKFEGYILSSISYRNSPFNFGDCIFGFRHKDAYPNCVEGSKVNNSGNLYIILDNKVRHLPDPQTCENLFGKDENYLLNIDFNKNKLEEGLPITPNAYLSRASADHAEVFLINDGMKRHISNMEVFNKYQFNYNRIVINPEILNLPDGPTI